MIVYAEVRPPWMGRVMYRINREIKKYAPPQIRFTIDPSVADFQILDVIGTGFVSEVRCKELVLFVQGFYPNWADITDFWMEHFSKARLVVSFTDIPKIINRNDFNFLHIPWGVDTSVFYPRNTQRVACIFTSGYDPTMEAISECRNAARMANQPMIHLGPRLPCFDAPGIEIINNVSDDELAVWYSKSWRVSGLRRGCGFELPCIEGFACGAEPIVFDTPDYRHWYGDFARFVKEGDSKHVTEQVFDIFKTPIIEHTEEFRTAILDRFSWPAICEQLWQRIIDPGSMV